jgi:hypothetical protein
MVSERISERCTSGIGYIPLSELISEFTRTIRSDAKEIIEKPRQKYAVPLPRIDFVTFRMEVTSLNVELSSASCLNKNMFLGIQKF